MKKNYLTISNKPKAGHFYMPKLATFFLPAKVAFFTHFSKMETNCLRKAPSKPFPSKCRSHAKEPFRPLLEKKKKEAVILISILPFSNKQKKEEQEVVLKKFVFLFCMEKFCVCFE